jgi:hypothetical protein
MEGEKAMDETEIEIHDLLREMGLNRTYTGYRYLVYILKLVREEPERLDRVTKQIYPEVSRAFQVEPGRVDSALRTAAKVCWQLGPEGMFVNPERPNRPPTVSQLLRLLAQEDQRRRMEKGRK